MKMPRLLPGHAALMLTLGLCACATFPELNDNLSPETRRAAYPDLVPVEDLRTQVAEARITDRSNTSLEARIAALRARAARLRGSVIDGASRRRLDQKITIDVPQ